MSSKSNKTIIKNLLKGFNNIKVSFEKVSKKVKTFYKVKNNFSRFLIKKGLSMNVLESDKVLKSSKVITNAKSMLKKVDLSIKQLNQDLGILESDIKNIRSNLQITFNLDLDKMSEFKKISRLAKLLSEKIPLYKLDWVAEESETTTSEEDARTCEEIYQDCLNRCSQQFLNGISPTPMEEIGYSQCQNRCEEQYSLCRRNRAINDLSDITKDMYNRETQEAQQVND